MNRTSPSPARTLVAIVAAVAACALVFVLVDLAVGKFAVSHFPAPEQALVWTRIGHFLAAILALAAGAQAWRLVRRAH